MANGDADRVERIQVFFDPKKNPSVTAEPDQVIVNPNEVVDIEWVQAGDNTQQWRFVFIGFMDPVGYESEIEIPRVHANGKSVTTRDTNKPPSNRVLSALEEKEKVYQYKIYVRQLRGEDRDTIWASDPEIINRRELGGG